MTEQPTDLTELRTNERRSAAASRAAAAIHEAAYAYSIEEYEALVDALEAHVAARRACRTLAMDDDEASPLRAAMAAGIDPERFA